MDNNMKRFNSGAIKSYFPNKISGKRITLSLLFVLSLASVNSIAENQTHQGAGTSTMATSVVISQQWARATFALAKTGAAYFSIENVSDKPLLLSSVSVDSQIAQVAQIHHTIMRNDMMQMQELSDGLKIESGETVEFLPGGKHIMLMGLSKHCARKK